MLKIALVDDDELFVECVKKLLAELLSSCDFNYSLSTFLDGNDLLNSKEKYDLFLFDIDMPTINGFDLAENFYKNLSSLESATIIYISNYEELVFESFRYSPFRFVRKNKLNEDLTEAIQAFQTKRMNSSYQLMISTSLGKKSLSVNDIIYIEVSSHKLNIHEKKQLIIANGNLKDIEETLYSHGFIKTHQSYLVNFRFINFIKHSEVILDDGTQIPLSRGRYEQVKKDYMIMTREQ